MRIHVEAPDPEPIEAEVEQLESQLRSYLAREPSDPDSGVLADPTIDWDKQTIDTTRALISARRRLCVAHRRRNEQPLRRVRSGIFTAHTAVAAVLTVLTLAEHMRWDVALACLVIQAVLCVLAWNPKKELVLRHAVSAAVMAATAAVTTIAALGALTSWVVVLTFPIWLAAFGAYLGATAIKKAKQLVTPHE
ncbi:hypothetical protein [Saccharomonospora sp.]|uniref:hypothetical protein n=1 Tax=Saccharomonospora sp. TaxID=33913 RepID=UPI002630F614|nr:hypothetical protein [Saccharomonospora sp.]